MSPAESPELDPRVRVALEEAGQDPVAPCLPDDLPDLAATVAAELASGAPPQGGVGMVLGASVITRLLNPASRSEAPTPPTRIDRRG
jgi:hypothetical protein